MPTYPQLGAEKWWGAEIQPTSLSVVCQQLREHYSVDARYIGSKGDNNHLNGYHRSRAWIKNSVYCTNRTYSVTETPGNVSGGNDNWLAAIDFQIPDAQELYAVCHRLDDAVRAGRLEKITQWFGSFDGKTVVGWNNIANRPATSDSSHLWHLHMSFDRGRVGENHDDLFAVLTGSEDEMTPEEMSNLTAMEYRVDAYTYGLDDVRGGPYLGEDVWLVRQLKKVSADVAELKARPPATVDVKALAAALVADPGFKAALLDAAFQGAQKAEKE